MNTLQKVILTAIVSAGIAIPAASSFAAGPDARGAEARGGKCGPMLPGQGYSLEQMAQRMLQLHDALALTSDQEAAWTTFVNAMSPPATQTKPDWAALSALTAPERMDKMLTMMKEREASMAVHVAAVKAFYAALTPAQQKTFDQRFGRHMPRPGR